MKAKLTYGAPLKMKAKEYNQFIKWVKKSTRIQSDSLFTAGKLVLVKGLSKSEAARIVGITPQYAGQAVKRLKELYNSYVPL